MIGYIIDSTEHQSASAKLADCDLAGPVWEGATRLVFEADALGVPSDAFFGDDGSVALTFYDADSCLEVILEPTGLMTYTVKNGYGFEFDLLGDSEDASESDVLGWLYWLSGKSSWSSSGSFVQVGGTTTRVASPIWLSSDPQSPTRSNVSARSTAPS